ncbi:hypothetical protein LshimejAT787_0409580 [Lyophyllum shimeji]|uniref:Uncharacterized protein n=1 Tax=Lyophyllum shimeji TaxID=47721 RepID=A0A9P3PMA4_LYOSH|nr:hypothetical protein LshimejAT787_0409580 [Lyophyllum shimeji]
MRAASSLYEHPHLSDSEVWPKDTTAPARVCVYSALGVFSLTTAVTVTAAAYRYTGLEFGRSVLKDSSLFKQWL